MGKMKILTIVLLVLLLEISLARDLIFKLHNYNREKPHPHKNKHTNTVEFASRAQPGQVNYIYETIYKEQNFLTTAKVNFAGSDLNYNLVFDTTSAGVLVFGPGSINNTVSKTYTCAHPYCKLVREDNIYIREHYRHHGGCADNKVSLNGSLAITGLMLEDIEIKDCEVFVASAVLESRKKLLADGTIGLQPLSGPVESNFLKILKQKNFIHKQVFSFFFDPAGKQSYVTIGQEQSYFSQEDFVTYQRNKLSNLWEVSMKELLVNGLQPKHGLLPVARSSSVVFDSILNGFKLSEHARLNFTDMINQSLGGNVTCTKDLVCDCQKPESIGLLPKLSIILTGNDKHYVLEGSDYAFFNEKEKKCEIMFSFCSERDLILGVPFLRKYYTVFDQDKDEVRISSAYEVKFQNWHHSEHIRWIVIGVGAALILFAFLALFLIVRRTGATNVRHNHQKKY